VKFVKSDGQSGPSIEKVGMEFGSLGGDSLESIALDYPRESRTSPRPNGVFASQPHLFFTIHTHLHLCYCPSHVGIKSYDDRPPTSCRKRSFSNSAGLVDYDVDAGSYASDHSAYADHRSGSDSDECAKLKLRIYA